MAFEGGVAPYPAGATAIGIAEMPPIPGIFLLDQTNISNAGALYDANGNKQTIPPFKMSAISNTPRILISYPVTLPGGGHLFSQIVPPIVFLNTEVFGQKAHTSGLANLTITPVMAAWSVTPALHIATGFDFILPTGSYSATKAGVATGYTTYSPVLALRYDNPHGLDIGVANRLLLNTKNGRTGYQSGNAYVADYIAGWNFGPLKLGAAGGFLDEYANDRANGATLAHSEQETFSAGPSVTYSGLAFGKMPFIVNANYQVDVIAKNAAKANGFWFNIAVPLFAAPPAAPGS